MVNEELLKENEEALRLAAHIVLAQQDYLGYATFIDSGYKTPEHVRLLGGYLNAVERGDIRKLAIIMPPRHSKSESTSGKFPGWCLGRDPNRTVIMTSYAAVLAEKFSMQNRDTIIDNPRWPLVFPGVTVNPRNKGRERWSLDGHVENVLAAGAGGSITGFGAWLFLGDDLVKNYDEAISSVLMESRYYWYTTTAHTRMTPDGRIVLIGTLWSETDAMSRILNSEEGKDFTILHLPALSYGVEEDYITVYPIPEERAKKIDELPKTAFPDPLGRHRDEPLWPEQFSKEFLIEQRLVLGHQFNAVYQGNPSAPEGTRFKRAWFRPITQQLLDALHPIPHGTFRSYDLAWSAKTSADYTVGLKATLYTLPTRMLLKNEDDEALRTLVVQKHIPPVFVVIEELDRWQMEWPETSDRMVDNALLDGEGCKLLVEAVASQNTGFKSLRRNIKLWKHTIIPIVSDTDKEIRAKYALGLGANGFFYILYPNDSTPPVWEKPFLDELGKFPNGKNDDQVDTLTQLSNFLQPLIDKLLLLKPVYGIWRTCFSPQTVWPQNRVNKKPPELRTADPNKPNAQLGWVRRESWME